MKVQPRPEQAKRLMRKLDLPADAAEVLTEARYWSGAFCDLYFDQCDAVLFEDPRAALPMAEVGLTLVERVASEHCRGGERQLRDLKVTALCVQGSALRAAGRLDAAAEVYEQACEIDDVSDSARANLLGRLAILRKYQQRFGEAEELLRGAIGICQAASDEQLLGTSLVMRGSLFLSTDRVPLALRDFSAALLVIDEKKNPRAYDAALHNLAGCLFHDSEATLKEMAATLRTLKRARRKRRAGMTLPKLKLRWFEGLIEVKFGFIGRGELSLRVARKGFVDLELPYEVALVSLDLSLLYLDEKRFDELRQLAVETFRIFRALSADRDATAALLLWKRAVEGQSLTSETVARVREEVHERMQPISGVQLLV